jgi:chromosome segregation ATPase
MSFLLAGSAAMSIAGGLFGSGKARRAARRAAKQAKALKSKLNHLENNRQAIINPYDNVTNLAGLASDLSNQLSNPFANLGVATQAAEIKIEQADISLANTLDTLRATGAGAGGATALAQAALQSKKEVAAGIESQEADNEKQRAQGEQVLQEKKMSEQQRMQKVAMDSAARQEDAMSKGRAYEFEAQENRQQSRINRTAAQLQNMQNQAAQARRDQTSAITGMFGGLASLGGSAIAAG